MRRPGQKAATNFISSPWLTCAAATASYKLKPQHKVRHPLQLALANSPWNLRMQIGTGRYHRAAGAFWTRHTPPFPTTRPHSVARIRNSAFRGRVCPVAVALSIHLAKSTINSPRSSLILRPYSSGVVSFGRSTKTRLRERVCGDVGAVEYEYSYRCVVITFVSASFASQTS